MSDIRTLSTAYEKALQAEWDNPGDARKRTAAATAAQKLADARESDRAGRPLGVVADSQED